VTEVCPAPLVAAGVETDPLEGVKVTVCPLTGLLFVSVRTTTSGDPSCVFTGAD